MKYFINPNIFLGLIFLSAICCQLNVLGPPALVSKLKNYDLGSGLEYHLGNFGIIPYGKTSVGYVFYHKNSDGKNTWCEFEKTSTPMGIENVPDGEYSPIFIVDYSTDCSMTRKAYNVKARGGRIMLLVSDDRSFKEFSNIDDKLGDKIDIATVIIKKDEGTDIKTYMENNLYDKVVMSVKFKGNKNNEILNIDYYLKSDDVKSIHFFTEFYQYYKKLKNKMNFTPHYKYMRYSWEATSNSITTVNDQAPCLKNSNFCSHSNSKMKITNGRTVLLENLRQSCIFSTFRNENMDLYWNYLINFSETCVDLNNILFTEECANDVMKYTGIDKTVINRCMEDAIKSVSGPLENDYNSYTTNKVHRVPELRLNGVKYRGSWHASNIFSAICSGFIDDDSVCATPSPQDLPGNDSGMGVGAILLIIVSIVLAMLILLICYKRIVNKSLEASLNEKIQSQTIHSLGQYQVFKDENTGRKSVDVSKL